MDENNRLFERDAHFLLFEKYHNVKSADFYSDLARLEKGEPLAYIIGNIPFLGCTIDLSRTPLIPRAETEFWVEKALHHIQKQHIQKSPLCILDIFSGSGCIGIALAKHLPNAHIDCADIDPKCIEQITINIARNALEEKRVQIFTSDVFTHIPQKKYHYIFANPPYISPERTSAVQPSVLTYEPHNALFADYDGTYYIKKLITEGRAYLKETGTMFIEMDPHQKEAIQECANDLPCTVSFWDDQFGNMRVAVVSYI